ncbi:hypothetical protein [Tolypothrix sp. VBCCA 56010]
MSKMWTLNLTTPSNGIETQRAIAPLKGAAFIAGWGALAFAAWSLK